MSKQPSADFDKPSFFHPLFRLLIYCAVATSLCLTASLKNSDCCPDNNWLCLKCPYLNTWEVESDMRILNDGQKNYYKTHHRFSHSISEIYLHRSEPSFGHSNDISKSHEYNYQLIQLMEPVSNVTNHDKIDDLSPLIVGIPTDNRLPSYLGFVYVKPILSKDDSAAIEPDKFICKQLDMLPEYISKVSPITIPKTIDNKMQCPSNYEQIHN